MKMLSGKDVGIIGMGVLGDAIKNHLPDAVGWDKYKLETQSDRYEVLRRPVVFICVPTPHTPQGCDTSAVTESLDLLHHDTIAIIKSTVPVGFTEAQQEKRPQLNLFHVPEFLTEATARHDHAFPDKQIVGFTDKSVEEASKLFDILPRAPHERIMYCTDAEILKYSINCFYALKVTFGNMIYDLCDAASGSYEMVKESFVADKRIADSHFDPLHAGYRGYGGKCLPKDMRALIETFREHGLDPSVLETADGYNEALKRRAAGSERVETQGNKDLANDELEVELQNREAG